MSSKERQASNFPIKAKLSAKCEKGRGWDKNESLRERRF